MSFTMEDFKRELSKEYFQKLSPDEQREVLQLLPPEKRREVLNLLPPEERLAGLSQEQIRQYLNQMNAGGQPAPRKPKK